MLALSPADKPLPPTPCTPRTPRRRAARPLSLPPSPSAFSSWSLTPSPEAPESPCKPKVRVRSKTLVNERVPTPSHIKQPIKQPSFVPGSSSLLPSPTRRLSRPSSARPPVPGPRLTPPRPLKAASSAPPGLGCHISKAPQATKANPSKVTSTALAGPRGFPSYTPAAPGATSDPFNTPKRILSNPHKIPTTAPTSRTVTFQDPITPPSTNVSPFKRPPAPTPGSRESSNSFLSVMETVKAIKFPSPPETAPAPRKVSQPLAPAHILPLPGPPPMRPLPPPPAVVTPQRRGFPGPSPRLDTPPQDACVPYSPTEVGTPLPLRRTTGLPKSPSGHWLRSGSAKGSRKASPLVTSTSEGSPLQNSGGPGSSPTDTLSAGQMAKERRMLFPSKSLPPDDAKEEPPHSAKNTQTLPTKIAMARAIAQPSPPQVKRSGAHKGGRRIVSRNKARAKVCMIVDLPPDLLIAILRASIHVDASCLGRMAMTCRALNALIMSCDALWNYLIHHEMVSLSDTRVRLSHCINRNEGSITTTAPNATPFIDLDSISVTKAGNEATGNVVLNDAAETSFEWFDVSPPITDISDNSNDAGVDATPRASWRAHPSRKSLIPITSIEAADTLLESLFAELMANTLPAEHKLRLSTIPRVTRLARVLLKLFHDTPLKGAGRLVAVEEWVKSSEFTDLLGLVCTCPLRQDLLPALRLLCHLQALCLKTSSPRTVPTSPSSTRGTCDNAACDDSEAEMPISERYNVLRHHMTLSATPIFDCDGKVLWEVVLTAEMMMFPLAGVIAIENPGMDHFTRRMTAVARPQIDLPESPARTLAIPGGDWPGVWGSWYGLFGQWEAGSPELHPMLLPHVNVGPCDPASMAGIIKHHEKSQRVRSGRLLPLATGLPWSKALPPIYFHGHSAKCDNPPTVFCVRGVARLTTDSPPEVRYTILIRKFGHDVMRFEGVQVGGVQSRRGVVGVSLVSQSDASWFSCSLQVAQRLNPDGSVKVNADNGQQSFGLPGWFVKL